MPKARRSSTKQNELVNIRSVAERANVSVATVSRTINRIPTVNPAMAKRVWDAISSLDYLPDTQARALVSGRSGILGLIVSEITNPFFPELIQGFEDVAVGSGYEILVSSTNYDPKRMTRCIRRMIQRKVEGVAVMTFGIEEPLLEQLAMRKIPMVFIDMGPDQPGIRYGVMRRAELALYDERAVIEHSSDAEYLRGLQRLVKAQRRENSENTLGQHSFAGPGWAD